MVWRRLLSIPNEWLISKRYLDKQFGKVHRLKSVLLQVLAKHFIEAKILKGTD
jgi:hypothetical protein